MIALYIAAAWTGLSIALLGVWVGYLALIRRRERRTATMEPVRHHGLRKLP